jgi:hypothetical protein
MAWDGYVDEAAGRYGLTKAQIAELRRRVQDAALEELTRRIAEDIAEDWSPRQASALT